jgi:hypothetical protein
MATQRCPKCKSKNIRHGYRPTHILFKLAFRYNLLCNDCNLEFKGFAIPGTVSRKGKKKRKITSETSQFKNNLEIPAPNIQTTEEEGKPIPLPNASKALENQTERQKKKVRKRVKVKLNRI